MIAGPALKTTPLPEPFPDGITNANWFSFFNAVSFQIFLGPPIILYAKSLGASAAMLGLLAALTPLLTVFQIPAAYHLERFGYRRFVLAGWGMRNICVFAVVAVPLLTFLGAGWKLALLLGLQFVFNLLRGIASGAWLPWLTEILPEAIRARFLSRDQRFMQTGSLASLLFCALVLQKDSQPWEFSLVFLISAIGGAASLFFLNKVPDVQTQEALRKSGTKVPWWDIITYPPFARLIRFNILLTLTLGGLGVFTITFLKDRAGLGENQILFMMATSAIAGVSALGTVGQLLDRFGSKQLLCWGLALHAVFLTGWTSLASGLLAPGILPLLIIFVISGMAASAMNLANTRLVMTIMPAMGRSHFFAFFSVITSLSLGISPILWGLGLDAMKHTKFHVGPHGIFEWNRYSIYYATLIVLVGLTFLAATHLTEKPPRPSEVE